MVKRIVDEAFVKELEETDQLPFQTRLDRLNEFQKNKSAGEVYLAKSKKPSWIGKLLFRSLRPLLEPYFTQQAEREREVIEQLHLLLSEIAGKIDGLSRSLRDVYVKSGEALAVLAKDIAEDFNNRIELSALSAGEIAKQIVADETAIQMQHLRLESKKSYQDLLTRSDLLIKHLETELEALEHDLGKHVLLTGNRVELCLSQMDEATGALQLMKQKIAVITNEIGLGRHAQTDSAARESASREDTFEDFYSQHQNSFRSSADNQLDKHKIYLEYFRTASLPIVDLGCGNGEFLRYLSEHGVDAEGVEISASMAKVCRAKGLKVEKADVLTWLAHQKNASYGAIFCSHMLEHLDTADIQSVVEEMHRILKKDGIAIVETINPESLYALTHAYFLDPTHKTPIPWKLMQFYFEASGFQGTEVKLLSEAAEREKLQAVDLESAVPATIDSSFKRLNRDIEKLNDFLFGHYDYAVVAKK